MIRQYILGVGLVTGLLAGCATGAGPGRGEPDAAAVRDSGTPDSMTGLDGMVLDATPDAASPDCVELMCPDGAECDESGLYARTKTSSDLSSG